VEGFSHCAFKSFKTEHEAKQYLAHGITASSPIGGNEHEMAVNYDMAVEHEMREPENKPFARRSVDSWRRRSLVGQKRRNI
jgi:hypothetical protein